MSEQTEPRTRREAMQRVQVGLIGLGGVLLVVAFANVVAKMRPEAAQVAVDGQLQGGNADNVAIGEDGTVDDLGVTPAPSVPDLEPDPRLRKPMDQDPSSRRQSAPQR